MDTIDALTLKEIKKSYGLGKIAKIFPIKSWGASARFLITLACGEKLFLKEKVFYLEDEEFIKKIALHNHIEENNGPVAILKRTIKGASYIRYDKQYFELQEWVDGKFCDLNNLNEMYLLGKTLATFQQNAQFFNNSFDDGLWNRPKARGTFFPDHPKLIQNYIKILKHYSVNGLLKKDIVKLITKKISHLVKNIPWAELPLGWIHGDASPYNSIYLDKLQKIILIDLDNARKSYKLWDLVHVLVVVGAFEFVDLYTKKVRSEWNIEPMKQIIRGYEEIRNLNKAEINNIIYLLIIASVLAFISEYDLDDLQYGICNQNNLHANLSNLNLLLNIIYTIDIAM